MVYFKTRRNCTIFVQINAGNGTHFDYDDVINHGACGHHLGGNFSHRFLSLDILHFFFFCTAAF